MQELMVIKENILQYSPRGTEKKKQVLRKQ